MSCLSITRQGEEEQKKMSQLACPFERHGGDATAGTGMKMKRADIMSGFPVEPTREEHDAVARIWGSWVWPTRGSVPGSLATDIKNGRTCPRVPGKVYGCLVRGSPRHYPCTGIFFCFCFRVSPALSWEDREETAILMRCSCRFKFFQFERTLWE